ncbi:diguanylate cyclase [Diaphorobacter sp. HDW4A]|uniref:GGDEF domain-containing protein n=1 Tax=Diaphorobacter sp. HDW4A TaxID=2714924 RepID=UPI00140754AF|nr:GGDEF domain-containing protein [Diaphorobacter sp. HDW4A]QIL78536.1 diguanylate cyclase [Diaphorobacter sp. HDW4A]
MSNPHSYSPAAPAAQATGATSLWMSLIYRPAINAALLGSAVFALCLFGIFSRTGGDLASYWPANAFLLGILIRYPHFSHRWAWIAAAAGYFLADAITGSSLSKNVLLNLANLSGVAVGYWIFHRAERSMNRLQTTSSVLYMLMAIVGASAMSGLLGAVAMIHLFNDTVLKGFAIWFATELVNYIGFLPLLLSIPSRKQFPSQPLRWLARQITIEKVSPAIALVLSAVFGHMVGGPGAVAFTIPALMWCAVSYSLFTTAFITFWVSAWSLISIIVNTLTDSHGVLNRDLVMSVRMGLSLVMLTPIMIGSVMVANRALVNRLKVLADHDELTNLPNRRAFLEASTSALQRLKERLESCSVLMIDIDHFKSVNDRFGHAAGDDVLRRLGQLFGECLRRQDIVGRLGGEEFAVFMPRASAADALQVAESIRISLEVTPITVPGQSQPLLCTVSIGLASDRLSTVTLDTMLVRADQCLYKAKQQGRNRVIQVSISD